jgi:hypothetical protein
MTSPEPAPRPRRVRGTGRTLVGIGAVAGACALLITLVLHSRGGGGGTGQALPPTTGACTRPYSAASPWNTPISRTAAAVAATSQHVPAGDLSSDPTQFTYPVYSVPAATPASTVRIDAVYSDVTAQAALSKQIRTTVQVPIPPDAESSAGSDGQLILLRPSTGDEWGFWQLHREGGAWVATDGYHYNTNWSGVPPPGFGSRGAGMTYLAGLIRPCEIARGYIDHAIAFAYDYPSPQYVYPARKSDGDGTHQALPEGTRLQLDPSLTDQQLAALGVKNAALVVAHALQTYGMYVVDNSGHAKIYFEDDKTAHWLGTVTGNTVRSIPMSDLRVVPSPPPTSNGNVG